MTSDVPDAVRSLFGALLMAVGWLMVALCGLCTAASLLFSVASVNAQMTLLALLLGGIPTLVGYLIFRAGKGLYDRPPPGPALPPANFSDTEPEREDP